MRLPERPSDLMEVARAIRVHLKEPHWIAYPMAMFPGGITGSMTSEQQRDA